MPKGKIKIEKTDEEKLKTSALLNGVKIGETETVANTLFVEIQFATAQQLWDTATMLEAIPVKNVKKESNN